MAVLKSENNINESLGSINIPNSSNIKINTTSYSEFASSNGELNNNQDKSSTNKIEFVNLEDVPEDAIEMRMYKGRLVKAEYIDSAKEQTEEIRKKIKELNKKYANKVDIDKIIDDFNIEEMLVKYMEENNTTEIEYAFISGLVLQVSKQIFIEYSNGDLAPPKIPSMHEMTKEEEERMKEKVESF